MSGSIASASYATIATTAATASYAATASSADNLTVRNTLTAQTLVVQTITSSVEYSSGSNVFGNVVGNTHQFTGSVLVSGSMNVNANSLVVNTNGTVSIGNTNSTYNLDVTGTGRFSSNFIVGGGTTTTSKLTILATTGVAAPGSPTLGIYDAANPTYGFDFDLEGVATGDLYLSRLVSGTRTPVLQLARATGAATFSSSVHLPSNSAGSNASLFFDYTSNAASRSWRISNDYTAYGDFKIQQSTTQTGSTYADILAFSATGAATFSSSVIAGGQVTAPSFNMPSTGNPSSTSWTFLHDQNYVGDFGIYAGSNNRLSILASGNVGIGTTSPGQNLTVYGTGTLATTFQQWITVNGTQRLMLGANTTAAEVQSAGSIPLYINYGGNRTVINGSGVDNVLIGTTTDNGYKLNLSGSQYISSYLLVGSGYSESPFCLNANSINGNGSTDVMVHITNTKYNSANSSGENRMEFGWGNHWAAALAAYKQSTNLTGFRFYGEQGYNTPAMVFQIDAYGTTYMAGLGTGTVYSNSGTLTNTNPSDRRLKENIAPITYGLNEVLQLNPVSFSWKDDNNKNKQFGFIAQEVQEIMPEAIIEGDYLGLEKDAIYATLVIAIQELKSQNDDLQQQINELKAQ